NDSAAGSQSNGFLFAAKPGGMSRNVIPYDNQYFDAITNTNLTASEHPYFSFTRYSDVNIYFVSMSWSILQRDKNNFDLFIDQKQPILHDLSKNILALILHRMTYMVTTHVKYHEEL
ncbi:MAG: hypothetical protein EB075_12015, partial [Bacteroidetes bacterium]|nr:hypothetical protein [Bacteroidota bacterium]